MPVLSFSFDWDHYSYIPAQIPYLGEIWFMIYGQNALGQLKCRNFESTLFPEQNYEIA